MPYWLKCGVGQASIKALSRARKRTQKIECLHQLLVIKEKDFSFCSQTVKFLVHNRKVISERPTAYRGRKTCSLILSFHVTHTLHVNFTKLQSGLSKETILIHKECRHHREVRPLEQYEATPRKCLIRMWTHGVVIFKYNSDSWIYIIKMVFLGGFSPPICIWEGYNMNHVFCRERERVIM